MNYNFDLNLVEKKPIDENQSKDLNNLETIEKPSFYNDMTWKNYKESFPWLIFSENRFWCSFCDEAFKRNEGVILTDWVNDKSIKTKIESKNRYNISRCRFDRHSKTQNHILSLSILNKTVTKINDEWTSLKEKYHWLDGNLEDTRCIICEESYKKHKKSMIITIWTCPELKSKQSKSHFTIEHRLDRHEKCKNHILAVTLENTVEDKSPSRKSPVKNRFLSNDKEIEILKVSPLSVKNSSLNNNDSYIDQELIDSIKESQLVISDSNFISDENINDSPLRLKKTRRSLPIENTFLNISCITRNRSIAGTRSQSKRRPLATNCLSVKHTLGNSVNLSTLGNSESLDVHVSPLSVRRSRKSAPVKSRKQSDVLPISISPQQYSTLKSRFQWLLCNNDISFLCEICLDSKVYIQFECDATLSFISRRILSHSQSETHIQNLDARGIHTTRLQMGINQKIDYKQLLNGTDNHTDKKIEIGSWSCPQCKSCFDHQNSLIEHISLCDYQSVEVARELSCPCNPLLYRFNTITKLDLHAVQEHSHKQLFNCYICSVRCNRLLLLYGHMLIHHLIDWDPFGSYVSMVTPPVQVECIFCSTSFITDLELNKHYKQSQCNKYLQPTVVIEEIHIDTNLLFKNDTEANIEIIDEHNVIMSDQSLLSKFIEESVEIKTDDKMLMKQKVRKSLSLKPISDMNVLVNNEDIHELNLMEQIIVKTAKKLPKKLRKRKIHRTVKSKKLLKLKIIKNNGTPELIEGLMSDKVHSVKKELSKNVTSLFCQNLLENNITSNLLEKLICVKSTFQDEIFACSNDGSNDLMIKSPDHKSVNDEDETLQINVDTTGEKFKNPKVKSERKLKSNKTKNRKNLFSLKLSEIGIDLRSADIDEAPLEDLLRDNSDDNQLNCIKKEINENMSLEELNGNNSELNIDERTTLNNFNVKRNIVNISADMDTFQMPDKLKETVDMELLKTSIPDNIKKELCEENINVKKEIFVDEEKERTLGSQSEDISKENDSNSINPLEIILDQATENLVEDKTIISLDKLKVCVEKMDIIVNKRTYRRKSNINIESVISPENEKRIRVPSEKLKNSVESLITKKRKRVPSERLKESTYFNAKYLDVVTFKEAELEAQSKILIGNVNFIEKKKRKRKMSLDYLSPQKVIANEKKKRISVPMTINELSGLSKSEKIERKLLKRKESLKKISKRSVKFANRFKKSLIDNNIDDNQNQVKSTPKRIAIRVKSDNSDATLKSNKYITDNTVQQCSLNEIIKAAEAEAALPSPDSIKLKKPIIIQSQLSPPEKILFSILPDEECIPAELSFMDRMKKIRQLKKIRTEQQREQMMVVDRTIAEINEKVHDDILLAKAEEIKKLLNCEQYSMTDLKNILHNERKKRHITDIDDLKPIKKSKLESFKREKQELFGCEACDLKFVTMKKRDSHISKEHKKCKLFKCKTCDLSLATHLGLKKHAMKFHPDNVALAVFGKENKMDVVTFQCHFCFLQFPTKYLLNSHISNIHFDNSDKHKSSNESVLTACPIVIDEFLEKLIEADPVNCSQPCPICNEIMENEFELAIHTIEHARESDSNFEANQFACPKCCRLFFGREGKTYLKDHYNIIHLQKPYPSCDECKTEFSSTWCYYEHKRTVKNCSKKSADQLSGLIDPYEQLNDPLRLAFVCSRCQTLVAGAHAQKRFLEHESECSLQLADDEEDSVEVNAVPIDHPV